MYRLLLGGLALVLIGCGSDAPEASNEAFACSPDTLRAGQTLTITLPTDAEGDLTMVDPNGTVYFAYRNGAAHPQLAPPPADPALPSGTTLRFSADSLQLKPYAYDARAAIPLFRQPGPYQIRLGAHLASGRSPSHQCTVHFAADRP